MPFSYALLRDVLVIECHGELTMADRLSCFEAIIRDETLPDAANIIIDVRSALGVPERDEVVQMTWLLRRLHRRFKSKIALVDAAVGRSTINAILSLQVDDEVCRVFLDANEASKWFG